MGPLGKGPWNEWERYHVFSLPGLVWYNTNRSDSPGKGCRGAKDTSRFVLWSRFVLGSRFFFGGRRRRSGVHGDARNDDQEAIFDTHVLDGGVRYASSDFCAVCFETQGKFIVSFDSQYLEQPHRRDKGHSKKCENHSFFALLRPTLKENENLSLL